MNPIPFVQANIIYGPPPGLTESQVHSVPAYTGIVEQGSVEGCFISVVAWMPTPEEREQIRAGCPIYVSVIGRLPAHFLTTDFHSATHPA